MSDFQFNTDGAGLPAGLTGTGTYTRSGGFLTSTGASPSGAGYVFIENVNSSNISLVINVGLNGVNSSSAGAIFRYVDDGNLWAAVINTTGVLNLYSRDSGSWTKLTDEYSIPSFSLSGTYTITVELDGNNIVIGLNAASSVITHTSSVRNTATRHGGRFGATGHKAGRLEMSASSAASISIETSDFYSQQQVSGSREITLSGTHGNQTGAINYKINGGSAVQAVASPAGTSWTFNVTLAEGKYSIEVFFADATSVTATVGNVCVLDWFHVIGQSNASGFGGSNQTYAAGSNSIGVMLGNDDIFKLMQDPFDSNTNQIRGISSYANAGGSWAVPFANAFLVGEDKNIGMASNSIGSVGVDRWQKTDNTRVDGLNLYEAMGERVVITGGCKNFVLIGGETNISAGMTKTAFKALLNQLVNDLFSDFGVKTIIVPFQSITKTTPDYDGNGTTTGQIPLRAAQVEVGAENANATTTQVMSDIVLTTVSPQDGLHYITNAQKQEVGTGERTKLFLDSTCGIIGGGRAVGRYMLCGQTADGEAA